MDAQVLGSLLATARGPLILAPRGLGFGGDGFTVRYLLGGAPLVSGPAATVPASWLGAVCAGASGEVRLEVAADGGDVVTVRAQVGVRRAATAGARAAVVAPATKAPPDAVTAEIDPVLLASGVALHALAGDDASLSPGMERALLALGSVMPRRLLLRRAARRAWVTACLPDDCRWTVAGELGEPRPLGRAGRAEDPKTAGERKTLVIATGKDGKGRSFRASLLACADADKLWDLGAAKTEVRRPVWFVVACSEQEAGPFQANLRLGRTAEVTAQKHSHGRQPRGERFELLRSAGYQYAIQRISGGVVITAFLPELFAIDPGMVDPNMARFVMIPAASWLKPVSRATARHVKRAGYETDYPLGAAPLFAAYLDRRTRAPLIPDERFYAQVLAGALDEGIAFRSGEGSGFSEEGVAAVGCVPGIAFSATHEELEGFLAEQVRLYEETV